MCGILGILNFKDGVNMTEAEIALRKIIHRGPDAQNSWNDGKHIYLGHNRLSIIDLSANANQPFFSAHADVAIIFNGEIYNYLQLKEGLTFKNFKTKSDTEVLLEGYIEKGVDFFSELRGIYAFAILDRRQSTKIILARDPSGVKPLFYYNNISQSKLVFASEIKAIKPVCREVVSVNEVALHQFINLGYIPEPNTAYSEIFALQPGHYLTWTPEATIEETPFFKFNFSYSNSLSVAENTEITEKLLSVATKRNLVADVKVSLALSGGIDSSLLYYYGIQSNDQLQALTVSFNRDAAFDEAQTSKSFSSFLGGQHEIINLDEKINLQLMEKIFDHFDQPYADSSAIPVYLLNQKASNFCRVLIGGDGGDELFNGYPSQTWLSIFYQWRKYKLLWNSLQNFGGLLSVEAGRKFARLNGLIQEGDQPFNILYNRNSWFPSTTKFNGKSVFKFDLKAPIHNYGSLFSNEIPDTFNNTIVFDYFRKTLLSDYLRKTDMMSMMNGVEYRVPMLDEDLMKHAFSIPFNQKSNLFETKKILRKIHHSAFPFARKNAPKSGFSIPLDAYLSIEDKKLMGQTILDSGSIVRSMIDESYIKFLLSEFYEFKSKQLISRGAVYQRVLILYNLQRWYSKL